MEDIHEVQDIQPCILNHVRCRDVPAKAGSVRLIGLEASYRPEGPN